MCQSLGESFPGVLVAQYYDVSILLDPAGYDMRRLLKIAGNLAGRIPRAGKFIWIAMSACTIAALDTLFFREVVYETQDAAANSLQIRRAKRFEEFEGTTRGTGLPSPRPGILLSLRARRGGLPRRNTNGGESSRGAYTYNILFQCALLRLRNRRGSPRRFSRRRWYLPLALLIWVLHVSTIRFAHLGTAANVWPPHLLGGPLFAFLVSLADFAAGTARPSS